MTIIIIIIIIIINIMFTLHPMQMLILFRIPPL